MKPALVPVAGLPPGADQENVNGPVPPLGVALHVTGLPTVADPHVTVTVKPAGGPTVTVWDAV